MMPDKHCACLIVRLIFRGSSRKGGSMTSARPKSCAVDSLHVSGQVVGTMPNRGSLPLGIMNCCAPVMGIGSVGSALGMNDRCRQTCPTMKSVAGHVSTKTAPGRKSLLCWSRCFPNEYTLDHRPRMFVSQSGLLAALQPAYAKATHDDNV
jgi:hypothetical protein